MKNTLFFLIIASYIFSCKPDIEKVHEVDLISTKTNYPRIVNPDKIRINSAYLFVLESPSIDSSNPPIHLLDRSKMSYIKSIGSIGFGPGEVTDASELWLDEDTDSFFVYSAIDKKISKFSVSSDLFAEDQLKQKGEFFKAYSLLQYTDATFLALTVDASSRLVEFDTKGDSIAGYGALENFSKNKALDNYNLSQINMGWLGTNPSKSHYVVANIFTNRIDILTRKSGDVKSIYLNPKEHTAFELISEPSGLSAHWDLSSPYHFRDVAVTNTHILALYGGISENKIKSTGEVAKTIYVFSLDGLLIAKLNLDTSIRSLAVTEDLRQLYGITTDAEPGIAMFEVPAF
ncbi:TolB-like 6-bladed beta-propeller domain-containing protein [Belliella sp. DSM 111904]|uniref:TolB-like 6-bladed beta-propeller domain-containing protein n=1 Tax=Belliella filtrata TaxID=2923435 RepID=A0ABS9V089_9BACT|nr:BF3164 family lipoprotein [Belliella filtrata]MCH7409774.1 TolB-like 6-bladed beta-propeller domain-containing protein [Belliella filtrata]